MENWEKAWAERGTDMGEWPFTYQVMFKEFFRQGYEAAMKEASECPCGFKKDPLRLCVICREGR